MESMKQNSNSGMVAMQGMKPIGADEAKDLELLQTMAPYFSIQARKPWQTKVKRTIDIGIAASTLLIASPIMLVLAAAIKSTSKGPILFSQIRVGKGGVPFRCYKFRSMVIDADEQKLALALYNEKDGPIFKMKDDPRITKVGKLIRRFSLDELPQLFNILNGDMTLVGPRPPVPKEVIQYEPWQVRRLSVVPGLTCIWQTSGRSKISFTEWMQMDLQYIDNWSLWLDIKLLFKTIKVVITADGAY